MQELMKGRKIEILSVPSVPKRLYGEFAEIEEETIINGHIYYKIKLENIQDGFGDSFTIKYGDFRFR